MSTPVPTADEIDPQVLQSFRELPTEDELPYNDGEPMETARHRDQMILLIESLKLHWAGRTDYYVSGNMFLLRKVGGLSHGSCTPQDAASGSCYSLRSNTSQFSNGRPAR